MKTDVNLREGFKNIFIKVFLILTLLHSLNAMAQTPPGDCPCDPDDPEYNACAAMHPECDFVGSVPIDADIKWLLCGGVALIFFAMNQRTGKHIVKNQLK